MGKSVLASICLSTALSTAIFAQIPDADTASLQMLTQAKSDFNKKDYFKSYQDFKSLQQKYPDDAEINFYVGRCALELKNYDEASAAFDRVLIKEPMNARAKLELARTYFETDQLDAAEQLFKEVRVDPRTPPKVQETIKKFLIAIDEKRQKSFTNAFLMVGYNYDSNVNAKPPGDAVNDVYAGFTDLTNLPAPSNAAQKEDYFMSSILGASNMYDVGDRGGWFIKSSLTGYMQNYRSMTEYNMGLLMATSGPTYIGKDYEINIPFHYNRVWKVDGQGPNQKLSMPYKLAMFQIGTEYMKDYGMGVKFNKFVSDSFNFFGGLDLKWKVYDPQDPTQGGDSNKQNNALTKILALGLTTEFYKNTFFTPTITVAGDEATSNGASINGYTNTAPKIGRNISNNYALNLALKYAFNSQWQAHTNYFLKEVDYKDQYLDTSSWTLQNRDDNQQDIGVGAQYSINADNVVRADYKHSRVDSTIKGYSYDKDTVSVNYLYVF